MKERIRTEATHSHHALWLDPAFEVFSSAEGWIFGFARTGSTLVFGPDPIAPRGWKGSDAEWAASFRRAWAELQRALRPRRAVFVAWTERFAGYLRSELGAFVIPAAAEPWLDARDPIPAGNSGRGVRAARNQALRAGVRIAEVDPVSERVQIHRLYSAWKARHSFQLFGFLNATDPFRDIANRRYFVARDVDDEAQAVLIATAIPGIQAYFFEDIFSDAHPPRGVSEFLVTEALRACGGTAREVSLGPVGGRSPWVDEHFVGARSIRIFLDLLFQARRWIYPFAGLELFRKRFRPLRWETQYLGVWDEKRDARRSLFIFLLGLLSLVRAFRPRWVLSARDVAKLGRHCGSLGVFVLSTVIFFLTRESISGKDVFLSEAVLRRFGFSADAPIGEWFYRTWTSDFLYFDAVHFGWWGGSLVVLLYACERRFGIRRTLRFFLAASFFDDFVNHALMTAPFHFLRPHFYRTHWVQGDVGGSLVTMALAGWWASALRKDRDVALAGSVLLALLVSIHAAAHFSDFLANAGHVVGFLVGYLAGRWSGLQRRK